MVPKECGLPASCFSYLGGGLVCFQHGHACNGIMECAVRGLRVPYVCLVASWDFGADYSSTTVK